MIEIDSESKGNFYCQYQYKYIICEGVSNSLWYTVPNVLYGVQVHLGNRGLVKIKDCPPLVLKPLSSIADEDIIEVAKLNGWSEDLGERYKERLLQFKIDIPCISTPGYKHRYLPEIFDYLRSKGYALSWMGLSVEEMVEAGWIKLSL